jgi:nucleoside phosphorylase
MSVSPVVMLTALNLEYQAVRARLTDLRVHVHDRGTRFEVGTLSGTGHRVVLGLTGKGNNSTAVLTERAVTEFCPIAVMFVGVAGALWDTPLGDVIVATHVYAYHGGTSEDSGFKARPRGWEITHELAQLAAHVGRSTRWGDDATTPGVHFGPVAAGEVVQNSRISAEAQWIRENYNDALAIEMEAAGLAQAAHLSGAPLAVIRGISDLADGGKTSAKDKAWQPVAAANAAAFAVRLAEELMRQREDQPMTNETGAFRRQGSVTNIAFGQVGIQAAHVTGNTVCMGGSLSLSADTDLDRELAALRDLIEHSYDAGDLDDDTYAAATADLDIANRAVRTQNSSDGRGKVVVALKCLRRRIIDVAELATKVAAAITAVQGLS